MKIKVIGLGAAGNKASVNVIEKEILTKDRVLLINSTTRDIPENFRSMGIKFSNTVGGCGKERDLSKSLCLNSIKDGTLQQLDTFLEPDDELCVIVNSTEGGTGSGAAAVIAKYVKQVLGFAVACFAFTGFEEDIRGLQNTIEYFQDMKDDYVVQAISNKKFLDEVNGNKLKAERLANDEFVKRISVLAETGIVDAEQNIDETDMYKTATMPGFMTIGRASLEKIKNVDQFNKLLINTIDEDKSLDINAKSQKRLAVFVNAKEETRDFIDYGFSVLKNKLGIPYEMFTHVQYEEDQEQYISFISAGMNMPLEEVKEVYEKYKRESGRVNKKKDEFFDFASELKGNSEDSIFNVGGKRPTTVDRMSFLDSFNEELSDEVSVPMVTEVKKVTVIEPSAQGEFKNTKVKVSKEDFVKDNF